MTLPARILAVLRHHVRRSDRARRRELVGQRAASLTLYPTTGRHISVAPQRKPRAVSAAGATTHQGVTDEHHE